MPSRVLRVARAEGASSFMGVTFLFARKEK
jgi:hypothetical protein